ncbi:hypothetical protein CVM52_21620 [Pseudooceanicola lipolyticus]|uniref:Uncharacterized protein n=2 Tax=Pseudooceanicola lipolyticus TaxID=2029104 RepID=A0A2M8IVK9_9RHOB|nr:hypothetical protein CVM52_21620 [Pseudooceanicola lipolyticus]
MFLPALHKLQWAARHVDFLDSMIEEYSDQCVSTSIEEPEHGEVTRNVTIQTDEITYPFTLGIGDIIRNLRAPLDFVISAMFEQHEKNPQHAYFPISDNRESMAGSIKGNLEKEGFQALTDFFLNEVEATETGKGRDLWVLNQLDRVNKHRNLILVEQVALAPDPNYIVDEPNLKIISSDNYRLLKPGQKTSYPIHVGAVIDQCSMVQARLNVIFGSTEILAGQHIIPYLKHTQNAVLNTLRKTQQAYVEAFGT